MSVPTAFCKNGAGFYVLFCDPFNSNEYFTNSPPRGKCALTPSHSTTTLDLTVWLPWSLISAKQGL